MTIARAPIDVNSKASSLFAACHYAAFDAGWWKDINTDINLIASINSPQDHFDKILGPAVVTSKLCLIHSEVSEAMEGFRKDRMDDKLPHRKMIEVELADAVIRIADLAGAMNLDLIGAIIEKMEFNATRPDHKVENRQAEDGKKF